MLEIGFTSGPKGDHRGTGPSGTESPQTNQLIHGTDRPYSPNMNNDHVTAQTESPQKTVLKGSGAGSVEGLPRATVFHKKEYLDAVIGQKTHVEHSSVDAVMMLLALCHTVVIDRRTGKFNSSSPDEIALLQGAKDQGYEFVGKRDGNILVVKIPSGQELEYKLLNVLEFNSTRKRMSVVIEDR